MCCLASLHQQHLDCRCARASRRHGFTASRPCRYAAAHMGGRRWNMLILAASNPIPGRQMMSRNARFGAALSNWRLRTLSRVQLACLRACWRACLMCRQADAAKRLLPTPSAAVALALTLALALVSKSLTIHHHYSTLTLLRLCCHVHAATGHGSICNRSHFGTAPDAVPRRRCAPASFLSLPAIEATSPHSIGTTSLPLGWVTHRTVSFLAA
jgi:hypothetical protein